MTIQATFSNDINSLRRDWQTNPEIGVLGRTADASSEVFVNGRPGYWWVRQIQAGGTYGPPQQVRGCTIPMQTTPGTPVRIALEEGEKVVIGPDFIGLVSQGVNPTQSAVVDPNANNPAFVNQAYITTAYGQIVEGTLYVGIRGALVLLGSTWYKLEGRVGPLTVPSSGNHCLAVIAVKNDATTFEIQYSTAKSDLIPLDITDLQEAWTAMSAPTTNAPLWSFELADGQTALIEKNRWADLRQILNFQQSGTFVVGPASSTDNAAVRFDGTTGKLIQNSGVIIDDSNNITVPGIETTQSGKVRKIRVVTAAGAVTVTTADDIVSINKTVGAATTVNLPATPTTGQTFVIHDGKGDAATNNITITPAAGNINGAGTLVLNIAYASVICTYNGTQWDASIAELSTGSPLTTKGDLYTYDSANARLPVGANNSVLVADSTASTGNKWATTLTGLTLDNGNTVTLKDTLFTLQNDGDTSKQAKFQLSSITTATTRTYTLPNADTTLVGTDATQTLTNKIIQIATGNLVLNDPATKHVTVNITTLSANRDVTFPDLTGTVLLDSSTVTGANVTEATGATFSAAGTRGSVPAPAAKDNTKVLSGAATFIRVSLTQYSQGADVTVASPSVAETTLIGSGLGSASFANNALNEVGRAFEVRAVGYATRAAGNTTIKIKFGGTTIFTFGPSATAWGTNHRFEIYAKFTVKSTGSSGTIIGQGYVDTFTAINAFVRNEFVATATTTLDLTTSLAVDVTWQWSNNTGQSVTCTNLDIIQIAG